MFKRSSQTLKQGLFWILLISFVAKLVYVFYFTDYSHYLFSDSIGYWKRALDRSIGKDIEYPQWAVWPPFAHIVLSYLFKLIHFFKIVHYRLQILLVLNVIFSTVNVYLLYKIAYEFTKKQNLSLLIAAAFAFSFPYFYFNAFVLSEHPSQFLLMSALFLTVKYHQNGWLLFLAGLLLAVSVGIRPANAFMGLPFFLYIVFAKKLSFKSVLRASVFSFGFFVLITGVVAENYRISEGKLLGLSSHGGVNFYFAQCQTFKVESHYQGYTFTLVPPSTVRHPEYGDLDVDEPFFNQGFFYDLGLECLRRPHAWLDQFLRMKALYLSPLFPDSPSAQGRFPLMEWFRYVALVLSLGSVGFLPVLFCDSKTDRRQLFFLFSIPFVSIVTMYFYNWEHRYMYSYLFVFYIFFFAIGEKILASLFGQKDLYVDCEF